MTLAYEAPFRSPWSSNSHSAGSLEDKVEVLRDIGDGSFGSVQLGRTRSAGAHIARRGTLVAIKTMKKTFENFAQCMELREVIFLKTLPNHPHLVPAYDIFLDPFSKKLHIAMEYMDGNLYQLMKARDHKPLDPTCVKSILFQILGGLEHIHDHAFFHRDIKPENILVSTSSPEPANAFKRYSALVTPPSTPPSYTIKIADFGLARETHSRIPYTTYVSTRWYRAPEVLLRAGEYSAPVDIWAIGAMAVEIATLKPLFPGGNEVDQVWRVCEIMGSPGSWVNKHGQRVGGGEWKEGIKLAQKLGFSFPKMAPHSLETVLPTPQWPLSLSRFVTWCLMWDPKARPTSRQALAHEYFTDAIDPLRPKSSKILGRKASNLDSDSGPTLSTKTSAWFRKSLGGSIPAPIIPDPTPVSETVSGRPAPVHASSDITSNTKPRPSVAKRATWANGAQSNAAPIPILPSVRPVSPLPDATNVQANPSRQPVEDRKKIGRQLSIQSNGNHYADLHRNVEAERALEGGSELKSPTNVHKESIFSHLRKRARRLSGRHQTPLTPAEDQDSNNGNGGWGSNHLSLHGVQAIAPAAADPSSDPQFADLERQLQNVRYSLDVAANPSLMPPRNSSIKNSLSALKHHHSAPANADDKSSEHSNVEVAVPSRTRRSVRHANPQQNRYDTPDEEDELLQEAVNSVRQAAAQLPATHSNVSRDVYGPTRPALPHINSEPVRHGTYLTPSPSKDQNNVNFGSHDYTTPSKPMDIPPMRTKKSTNINPQWPTPPYDDNDWAAAAAASILATQAAVE